MSEQSDPPPPAIAIRSLDLRTAVTLALVVAVGVVVAQFAQTVVQAVVLPVAEEAVGHPRLDDGYLTLGSREIYYGAALAATMNVVFVAAVALVARRILGAERRRRSTHASDSGRA